MQKYSTGNTRQTPTTEQLATENEGNPDSTHTRRPYHAILGALLQLHHFFRPSMQSSSSSRSHSRSSCSDARNENQKANTAAGPSRMTTIIICLLMNADEGILFEEISLSPDWYGCAGLCWVCIRTIEKTEP